MRVKWIIWQVLAPIFGPMAMSVIVVLAWRSGQPQFPINWYLIVEDITPWALTFYCITLIGATMDDLWPELQQHPGLGLSLIMVALAVALYASFIVIWRHDRNFTPGVPVYVVTFLLLTLSIVLCHEGAKVERSAQ